VGNLDPIEYMVHWAHASQLYKRHVDRFSRFTRLTRVPKEQTQTDGQTTLSETSVATGRSHAMHAMRSKTTIVIGVSKVHLFHYKDINKMSMPRDASLVLKSYQLPY